MTLHYRLQWYLLSRFLATADYADAEEAFADEQRKTVSIEEAHEARNRKLTSIGSGEIFPAGFVILEALDGSHRIRRNVVVAVTTDDLVLLDADVIHDPDDEVGRIRKADVTGVRMVDEAGDPIAMTQARDVLELDEPEHSYVVALDRRDGDQTLSQAFVFRSLSVADEARRDFDRNLTRTA